MRVWKVMVEVMVACDTDPMEGDALFNASERLQQDLEGYPGLILPTAWPATSTQVTDPSTEPDYIDVVRELEPDVTLTFDPAPSTKEV